MCRSLLFVLALLGYPYAVLGSQSFESLPTNVSFSGFVGSDTFTISASLSADAHPYKIETLQVTINDERLQFPQKEVEEVSNPFIQLISITHSGAKGTYEIFIPFSGEGYCDNDAANTRSISRGTHIYRFTRSFDYLSSSTELPEESCKEDEEYVIVN